MGGLSTMSSSPSATTGTIAEVMSLCTPPKRRATTEQTRQRALNGILKSGTGKRIRGVSLYSLTKPSPATGTLVRFVTELTMNIKRLQDSSQNKLKVCTQEFMPLACVHVGDKGQRGQSREREPRKNRF